MTECLRPTMCHMSGVRCQVSCVMCQVSCVTCQVSGGQRGGASRWRVCYQQGLPRLVFRSLRNTQPPGQGLNNEWLIQICSSLRNMHEVLLETDSS